MVVFFCVSMFLKYVYNCSRFCVFVYVRIVLFKQWFLLFLLMVL
jgi:hypothetical protein